LYFIIQFYFFNRLLAAVLVTLATAPSVALLRVPSKRSVSVLPPKTNANITTTKMRVKGRAIMGDDSQTRISSNAAIPSNIQAQEGMEAE